MIRARPCCEQESHTNGNSVPLTKSLSCDTIQRKFTLPLAQQKVQANWDNVGRSMAIFSADSFGYRGEQKKASAAWQMTAVTLLLSRASVPERKHANANLMVGWMVVRVRSIQDVIEGSESET